MAVRLSWITAVAATLTLSACVGDITGEPELADDAVGIAFSGADVDRGRDIWFDNTYGGGKFFILLANHPDPHQRLRVGFEEVLRTPRSQRFDVWGVINDPDCHANPVEGEMDICPEGSTATGVVGIRKEPSFFGQPTYGVSCASCHAGFDPLKPPKNPNEPKWENVHATIGNMYLRIGDMFAANLEPTDVRQFMFASWPLGTVDTTALFNDGIMNTGAITAFWEHDDRNRFHVTRNGQPLAAPELRNGQGGEDDVGDLAALRVYTNIGVCYQECVQPSTLVNGEIDIATCYANCPDFPPQQDLDDMTAFLRTFEAPQFPGKPILGLTYFTGQYLFDQNCASCHDRSGDLREVLSNDEITMPIIGADGQPNPNATNACRALSSNWLPTRVWGQFSSDQYKQRILQGSGPGYRSMPLAGIWSTSPFMHNNSIGYLAPAHAKPAERALYYWASMWELLSADREPVVHTFPVDFGPIAKGTPLHYVFSRNPNTGEILCGDLVENKGHYYGSNLPDWAKGALIYWLQYQ